MTRPIGNPASSKKSVPDTPTFTVTANNANRPFNNGSVNAVFTPPAFDGKMPITSYRLNSSDGQVLSGTANITVEGLVGGSSYTFTGNALNIIGPSATTPTSSAVPVSTVPSTPTMTSGQFSGTIPFGNAPQLVVGWTNSNAGGSSILRYEYSTDTAVTWRTFGVAASPGSTTVQGNGINFVAGSDYTVYIRGVNANGVSLPSTTGVAYRAATVPQAPTTVTATRISNTVARLTWTAGGTGGSPLTTILINCTPNANTPGLSYTTTDVDGTIDVTGPYVLNQGYTFTINVSNAFGTSLGATSNSVTLNVTAPVAPTVTPTAPTVTPTAPTVTPTAPTAPTVTPTAPTAPTVTPTAPTAPTVTPTAPAAPTVTPTAPTAPTVTPTAPSSCVPNQGEFCEVTYSCGACNCCPYPCYRPGRINCSGGCTLSGGFYC
jgi:hypothetical protein